ncbi:MAG: HAMP domain-containing protein, partial [Gammaproteobacteria bacterium]|nr:HAMP domain-containing protein [Gammaproteobacteria bacterium]
IFPSGTESDDVLVIKLFGSPKLLRTLDLVLIAIILSVVATAITALYSMNRISRPMTQLAYATQSFRGVSGYDPLPETGSDEVVLLARSFNDMAEEISALISNRTTITAGLSHDLRTPLTRMRLALELLPEDTDPNLLRAFEENLQHMNSLISDAALFAKGEQERPQKMNFRDLVQSIVHTVDKALVVEWFGAQPADIQTAPNALRRCVTNLVQNAMQYGKNVRVQVRVTQEDAEIHVLDDGPGIPKAERQRILQPFVRLDKSRNLETGGSGLGLAIVNQLCLIHNWTLEIGASPAGGTDVAITIPTKVSSEILRGTSDLAIQERLADVK